MAARSLKVHAGRLLAASLAVILAGWLVGHPLPVMTAALLAYLLWHLWNLWRLFRWLHGGATEVPESFGIWSNVYDRIAALEKETRAQRERHRAMIGEFRSLTDAFPDATLVIDGARTITWFNQAAVQMLGLRSPEDLGKPVTNLLRGPDFANWLAAWGRSEPAEDALAPRSDNVWLSVTAIPFQEHQRLIILRDNTEVHNVEQLRRDFVANVSHELRTPLTVLQGYLELLQDSQSGEVSEAVSRMLVQTAQMQMLLDDLLELSRLQSDEIQGEETAVDARALMQLKEQADELSRGRHQLHFEVAGDRGCQGSPPTSESALAT
jgi:two-component system phosphate regulon sensor histidine kinase PhoR